MLSVLGNRTYRHLFLVQVLSLIGTVGLAPVAAALAGKVPRRRFLVGLDS